MIRIILPLILFASIFSAKYYVNELPMKNINQVIQKPIQGPVQGLDQINTVQELPIQGKGNLIINKPIPPLQVEEAYVSKGKVPDQIQTVQQELPLQEKGKVGYIKKPVGPIQVDQIQTVKNLPNQDKVRNVLPWWRRAY